MGRDAGGATGGVRPGVHIADGLLAARSARAEGKAPLAAHLKKKKKIQNKRRNPSSTQNTSKGVDSGFV